MIDAGCRDPFGFVPAAVSVSVPIEVDVPTTLTLVQLPAADVMVGDVTARVAYGSLVVFDDRDDTGTLELATPQRAPSGGGRGTAAAGRGRFGRHHLRRELPDDDRARSARRLPRGGVRRRERVLPARRLRSAAAAVSPCWPRAASRRQTGLASALAGGLPPEDPATCSAAAPADATIEIAARAPADVRGGRVRRAHGRQQRPLPRAAGRRARPGEPDGGVRAPADVRHRRRKPGLGPHPARRLGAHRRSLQGPHALHAARLPRRRELSDPRLGLHGQPARVVAVRTVSRRGRVAHERWAPAARAVARARGVDAGGCGGRDFARARDDVARARDRRPRRQRRPPRPPPRTTRARRGSRCRPRPIATPGCAAVSGSSLGLVYGRLVGLEGAPSGRLLGATVRVGLRLDADWSVLASFQYASASAPGGLSGLRFAGTIDPTWHVTRHLALALGLGFGGIVEGRTGRPDVDPLPDTLETSYTFPSATPPLPSCSGVGAAALARAEWTFVLGPRSATSLGARGRRSVDRLRRPTPGASSPTPGRRSCAASAGRTPAPPARGASRGGEARAARRRRWRRDPGAAGSTARAPPSAARRRRRRARRGRRRARRRRRADAGDAPAGRRRRRRRRPRGFEPPHALGRPTSPTRPTRRRSREPVVGHGEAAGRRDRRGAEGRARHAAAAAVRRRGDRGGARLPLRARRATAASRSRSRSRSRTRSCPAAAARRRRARRADAGPPRTAVLRGQLVELGTRAPVAGATVTADGRRPALHDRGRRQRALSPAAAARPGARRRSTRRRTTRSCSRRRWRAQQELAVTYLVERDRYDPYEIVVVGEQRREEVSRITLRGAEIKQVPGTFGDPFRVIQTLPGVASVVSLLPFPIVRGASPSSTGFLLDGTRVPLLFHLLSGPERRSTPSSSTRSSSTPAARRRRTAATPAASSTAARARARPDEHLIDIDVNLLQVGRLRARADRAARRDGDRRRALRLSRASCSASRPTRCRCRTGTTSCGSTAATPRNGWTVFAFGARDELDTVGAERRCRTIPTRRSTPSLILGFHRARPAPPPDAAGGSRRRTAPCSATTARSATGTDFCGLDRPSRRIDATLDARASTLARRRRRRAARSATCARARRRCRGGEPVLGDHRRRSARSTSASAFARGDVAADAATG